MSWAWLRLVVMSGLVVAPQVLLAQAPSTQAPAPQLTERQKEIPAPETELDSQVTARVTVPTEAEGRYTFGRAGESIEMDFEPRGLTGYITMLGDARTDKRSPLTFFFAKTRLGGDNIYFATHQIHRSWYEFSGVVAQTPPREKSLLVEYSLVGTLTIHRMREDGTESRTSRKVKFKQMR